MKYSSQNAHTMHKGKYIIIGDALTGDPHGTGEGADLC